MIKLTNVNKAFKDIVVLENFNMEISENEYVTIVGKSGCGKSTLLNIVGLLDVATSGDVELFGHKNVKPYSSLASKLLKEKIGYLFQSFALLENQSVHYNLMLCIENTKIDNKEEKILQALEDVGLAGYEHKKVYKCSGGEQQRIAIARLLLKPCLLVLADEPTGSLDKENKEIIFSLLKMLHEKGKTILVVTHDGDMIQQANRVIKL